jgi:chromosome segregation ATPase
MHTITNRILGLSSLVALTIGIGGCASPNYNKGSATASGLKESSDKIQAASVQLNATLDSLNDLVTNSQPDLRPQYKKFSGNVDELGKLAQHVDESVKSMRERSKEFFAKWNEELATIKNEDIRNRSASRQKEVSEALNNVKQSYADTETAFRPLMSDLRDIQKYLGTDLTPAGVAGMKDVAAKVNTEGAKLKEALGKLSSEFKSLGVAMSAVAPATK